MSRAIELKGSDVFLTTNKGCTYTVEKGSALIYIIPLKADGEKGRRIFLYEAPLGSVIPAFDYTDYESMHYIFCISALESVCIREENDCTEEAKALFSKTIGLVNYDMEGFEEGLAEWYRLRLLKEDGFIHKTGKERKDAYEKSLKLIYSLFDKNESVSINEGGKDSLYKAVKYVAKSLGINVADYERILKCSNGQADVESIARISHFITRKIILEENWYTKDCGNILVYSADEKKLFACVRQGKCYVAYDPWEEKKITITKKNAEGFSFKAYMVYRPFKSEALDLKKLLQFGMKSIKKADLFRFFIMTVISALIGLFIPVLNRSLYDLFIPIGAKVALIQMCCVILAFMIGSMAFSVVKNMSGFIISSRVTYDVQNAVYHRLFNLRESFFRQYDSADLASRIMGAGELVNSALNLFLSMVITIVLCVVYAWKMATYSQVMTSVAIVMLVIYTFLATMLNLKSMKHRKETMELSGKSSSVLYQLLTSIEKIRIAGVEDRALYEYLKPYTKLREKTMKTDKIELISETVAIIAESMFSLIMYAIMVKGNVNLSLGMFIAFNSAFGSLTSAVLSLASSAISMSFIKPMYERIKPVIEAMPELEEDKEIIDDITGDIEISNVDFAYDEGSGNVLNSVNLHIRKGEYIGITGASGSGKSTLLKLLLGFEKPTHGKIYYDGIDLESLDKRELRKKMGVVLQNGELIGGSIYENITITSPMSTYNDVDEVLKKVGLYEDVHNMPMGLHTALSEDCDTISGGQKQRILIARAIVSNPQILYFDEATSALDNVTQREVCKTLEELDTTRVVIAHRLSTIINCDRIIVMDKGMIVEEGTYDELMNKKGKFYNIAKRQIL